MFTLIDKKEIGSEFWNVDPIAENQVYLLSGRTALEYIIRDILKEQKIESALLPSYCCHTMIEPFCRHQIQVRFYDVFMADGVLTAELPEPQENEIFYYMTYFGYSDIGGMNLKKLRQQYSIIIEDRTHSWLTGDSVCDFDYSYTSFRKWTGFSGLSVAEKKNGSFSISPGPIHEKYCAMRENAAALKKAYIEKGIGDKQVFLSLFNEAEELLETDYVGYAPTNCSLISFLTLDRKRIVEKRRRNAVILMKGLRDVPEVQPIFSKMNECDVPLFVPALIQNDRVGLRRHLIENQVYCPVHWPLSDLHGGISTRAKTMYDQEMSLICDQRYDETAMYRIINLIREFYKR